jgi:hypothetical protein
MYFEIDVAAGSPHLAGGMVPQKAEPASLIATEATPYGHPSGALAGLDRGFTIVRSQ